MIRLALDYVKSGMILGRDINGTDGQIVLAAGVELTDKYLELLGRWGVVSVYVTNPGFELPELKEVVTPVVRAKTVRSVKAAFNAVASKGTLNLSNEHKQVVADIINQVLLDRSTVIHLTHISRHQQDLFTHSVNVAIMSVVTGIALGFSDKELYDITLGALMHDIGKMFVPKSILEKKEPYVEEEVEILKTHTTYGFEMLRRVSDYPLLAAHVAFQHHERFDGTGYPRGMEGREINVLARVVAVANEYDNMISDRPSMRGMEAHAAYEHILAGVGSSFSPEIARAFLSKIAVYPVGTVVRLTTGQIGVVTGVTSLLQHRPEVRILRDSEGLPLEETLLVNLANKENLTVFIDRVLSDYEKAELLTEGCES